jgi:hypothetical protein
MPSTPYENCCSAVYGREVSNQRSNNPFLWDLEAISKQGSFITTNGLFGDQGVGTNSRGCHNVYEHHYEGYVCWE